MLKQIAQFAIISLIVSLSLQDYDSKYHLLTIHWDNKSDDLVLIPKHAPVEDIDKVIQQIEKKYEQKENRY